MFGFALLLQIAVFDQSDLARQKEVAMYLSVQNALKRNVVVQTEDNFGSGVVLDNNLVLTVFHLIGKSDGSCATSYPAVTVNGKPARVLAANPQYDLLFLKVETPKVRKLRLAKARVFDEVFYAGNPMEHIGIVSTGRIVFINDEAIHADVIAAPGFSGSGLYNFQGELVGLLNRMEFMSSESPTSAIMVFALAVKAEAIKEIWGRMR